jgi:ribonuclease HII
MATQKKETEKPKAKAKPKKRKGPPSRLKKLLEFDRNIPEMFPEIVIGFDEVGRGCLAGPVVAAAVRLPEIEPRSKLAKSLAILNDSKLLLPKYREELAAIIQDCSEYAICEATVEEIDEINILHASLLAMKRCRQSLRAIPRAVLLVDGNMPIPGVSDPQIPVVQGDSKSASIAAASIIAKVYRDALMTKLSVFFPDYMWNSNKGYRSSAHWSAIDSFGITPWHRKAFIHGPREVEEIEETEGDQLEFLDELKAVTNATNVAQSGSNVVISNDGSDLTISESVVISETVIDAS